MSNTFNKLLISFTTASALGTTAVIANPSRVNAANKVDLNHLTVKQEKDYNKLIDAFNSKQLSKMTYNYEADIKIPYTKTQNDYLNTKAELNNANVTINQSQNSVSVNLPNGYKNDVQNTLNNYMNTKDADTLSKNQTALIMNTQPASIINASDRNYKTYQMLTYIGHTATDSKKFYVDENYDDALSQLTPRDMQEIQQVVANAGNALRSATGITNQVGNLIPNQTIYSVSQALDSNLNSMTLDDTANSNGINGDFLMDVYNRNVSDPMPSSIQTYKDTHKNYRLDHFQKVITLADIKQLYLNALASKSYQIDLLGLQQYQLDNTSQYGTSDSYFGLDNTNGKTNPAMLVTIPKNVNSLSNPDFSNPFAKLDAANLTQTTSTNTNTDELTQLANSQKADYDKAKSKYLNFFNTYNKLTGNPKNNREIFHKSLRYKYFLKTGKVTIPGGYRTKQ